MPFGQRTRVCTSKPSAWKVRKPHHTPMYIGDSLSLDEKSQTLPLVELENALLLLVFIEERGITYAYKVLMRFGT